MNIPLVIGIAGGTGSGKTTVARVLSEIDPQHAVIVPHDAYYRAQHDLPREIRAFTNYDESSAFDTD